MLQPSVVSPKGQSLICCKLCEREVSKSELWGNGWLVCKLCANDYIRFRKAYKAEHGRWPKLAEFLSDEI